MSRHPFTAGDQRWTVGYDPAMATYYAQTEPLYWPQLPTTTDPTLAVQLLARDHDAAMRRLYGPDHTDPDNGCTPLMNRISQRYRTLLDHLHQLADPRPYDDDRLEFTEAVELDDEPLRTVLGDHYGEVRSLEDLQASLTGHVELPAHIRAALDTERRSPVTNTELLDAHRHTRHLPPTTLAEITDAALTEAAHVNDLLTRAFPPPATPPPAHHRSSTGHLPPAGPGPRPAPRR